MEDQNLTPYYLKKRQLLSATTIDKRLQRLKTLLSFLKKCTLTSITWTDAQSFTIEQALNRQNDHILERNVEDTPVNQRTVFQRLKPASIRVWAGVTFCGDKSPLIFIPKGIKVNGKVNIDMLESRVLPRVQSEVWEDSHAFQQDVAPSHTANRI